MRKLVTIVVPVAPFHMDKIGTIKTQVARQTIPCDLQVVVDEFARGAAWARNEGVKKSTTPFVAFCDADDFIVPQFAQKLLASRSTD